MTGRLPFFNTSKSYNEDVSKKEIVFHLRNLIIKLSEKKFKFTEIQTILNNLRAIIKFRGPSQGYQYISVLLQKIEQKT